MPKKDAASAVRGMLSAVGEQTRRPLVEEPPVQAPDPTPTVTVTEAVQASVSPLPTGSVAISSPAPGVPRTLRLRPTTAARLRDAWLQAKRDDVLLTAQDFASDLVEEALTRREWLSPSTS